MVGLGVWADEGVGVCVTDGVGLGVDVGVELWLEEPLKFILGLLLSVSVRSKESVVSRTTMPTVPESPEVTVKLAWPF
jgi:hypothetical protein